MGPKRSGEGGGGKTKGNTSNNKITVYQNTNHSYHYNISRIQMYIMYLKARMNIRNLQ